jgi:hypothetical protein
MALPRRPGSGLANASAAAIEEVLAAALRRDEPELQLLEERLEYECSIDRCGMEPDRIVRLLRLATDQLSLDVVDAVAQPLDGLGDVRASLRGGARVWFEVKAQTKKDGFDDLTQADWVRDETDLLRWMYYANPMFAEELPPWIAELLELADPEQYFDGWTRDALWIADMALLVKRDIRERAGVHEPGDLGGFLARKFVVHLTREGVRIIRLDEVMPVAAALTGQPVSVMINYANKTAAALAFACPGPAVRGAIHFTYHVGYATVVGRHKMHARSLRPGGASVEISA